MAIEEEITAILTREMPGAQVEVARNEASGKVTGEVIWDGFEGHKHLWRQNRIFALLRRNLGSAQAAKEISFIFTYTPREYELASAD